MPHPLPGCTLVKSMTARPVNVYLDSSDFSHLSDPRAPAILQQTRDRLLELAQHPRVKFVFSGAHLSEMAPLEARYADAAARRTDLLVSLCKRRCLISFDRLMSAEIQTLINRSSEPVDAISGDGNWFPDIGQIVTPAQAIDAVKALDDKANELGLSRKERRALQSRTTRRGKFRSAALDALGNGNMDEILKVYPMRREDAEVIMQYVVGKVSARRADQAFLESLRDPRWMMRWFREHHDRLGVVGDWVRGPARKLTTQMVSVAGAAARALQHERVTGKNPLGDQLTTLGWQRSQDELLLTVINRVALAVSTGASKFTDAGTVDNYCPGIAMCIRVTHSSLRNSIGNTAREPKPNDFVDAIHSMYAPYVDVFRGDRYMSPIVSLHASKYGTKVVAKLEEAPAAIESALA
ncbi:hypothetical protein J2X04_000952 [Lysobacter niabensis]|uniref:Uncharacterized protein n=1 Tax=Agrilutibacter niabensis TaxID=380628 RepID=A0ABU1VM94_9GAMM|nr:hypothetical protein [Lysobacter niabensis]MDR7098605.1 hypothetical protein [Lysobacter niabensis]